MHGPRTHGPFTHGPLTHGRRTRDPLTHGPLCREANYPPDVLGGVAVQPTHGPVPLK
jgi:hypothetical protein